MTRRRAADLTTPAQQLGVVPDSPLAALLTDASAPGRPEELAGLPVALYAYRARSRDLRRSPVTSTVLAKLLAAKALVAAGSLAMGGVALAAATGSLPVPGQPAAHSALGAPMAGASVADGTVDADDAAASGSDAAGSDGSDAAGSDAAGSDAAGSDAKAADGADAAGSDGADATGSDATSPAAPVSPTAATPHPSLLGLCHAYRAGVATAHGKALDNPAFTMLVTTAGGRDTVAGYCATLLATAPGAHPTAPAEHRSHHQPAHLATHRSAPSSVDRTMHISSHGSAHRSAQASGDRTTHGSTQPPARHVRPSASRHATGRS